jgi:hypothetical protein
MTAASSAPNAGSPRTRPFSRWREGCTAASVGRRSRTCSRPSVRSVGSRYVASTSTQAAAPSTRTASSAPRVTAASTASTHWRRGASCALDAATARESEEEQEQEQEQEEQEQEQEQEGAAVRHNLSSLPRRPIIEMTMRCVRVNAPSCDPTLRPCPCALPSLGQNNASQPRVRV